MPFMLQHIEIPNSQNCIEKKKKEKKTWTDQNVHNNRQRIDIEFELILKGGVTCNAMLFAVVQLTHSKRLLQGINATGSHRIS